MLNKVWKSRILWALLLTAGLSAGAQRPDGTPAPSASIPPRLSPPPQPAPNFTPNQRVLQPGIALDDEYTHALAVFREKYQHAKSPRILVLFNRDLEDNDSDTMVKTFKVQGGVSTVNQSASGTERTRSEGGLTTFAPAPAKPNAYSEAEMNELAFAFERPFLAAGARVVDRDTAVRLHGITAEEVFAYQDLPETKRSQVEGLAKQADLLITVSAERGSRLVRKVSGDYYVEQPNLIVKAIRLSDAQTAAYTSSLVLDQPEQGNVAERTALSLMELLAQFWGR